MNTLDTDFTRFNVDPILVSDLIELFEGEYKIKEAGFDSCILFQSSGIEIRLSRGLCIDFEIMGQKTQWHTNEPMMPREEMVKFFARKKAYAFQYYQDCLIELTATADNIQKKSKHPLSFRAKDTTLPQVDVLLHGVILFTLTEYLSEHYLSVAFDPERYPESGTFAFYIKDNEVQDDEADLNLNPVQVHEPKGVSKDYRVKKVNRCFHLFSLIGRECDVKIRDVLVKTSAVQPFAVHVPLPDVPLYDALSHETIYQFLEFTTKD